MAEKRTHPQLIRTAEKEYNCSACGDFKVEIIEPTQHLWELIKQDYAEHLKRRHSESKSKWPKAKS
jgi:hypothetical protein